MAQPLTPRRARRARELNCDLGHPWL